MPQPKCFVVMGFGEKVDLATGRTLDLDKSYRIIIKPAVEAAGFECIRADDIIHAGTIDKPMYDNLNDADLVVADLSTANLNAIYELGVRHALRPFTTIVMAEDQFKFPFDIGHLVIRTYQHLGKGIDAEVAEDMRKNLTLAINTLHEKQETDSPVYTFLPNLAKKMNEGSSEEENTETNSLTNSAVSETKNVSDATPSNDSAVSLLMDMFKEARAKSDWDTATMCLGKLLERRKGDPYLIQQLALATYKSKKPDPQAALLKGLELLSQLNPMQTTDSETLGLWGAIRKRLWDLNTKKEDLDEAIWAYEKGFYLKNDFYNGINFAFLLNVRASVSEPREAVADIVAAERVRKQIIDICEKILAKGMKDDEGKADWEQEFWVRATLMEALVGIGDNERAENEKEIAMKGAEASGGTPGWKPEGWMVDTMNEQLDKLKKLLSGDQYEVKKIAPGGNQQI